MEEECGPESPPCASKPPPDHLQSPTWSLLVNLMFRVTHAMSPPPTVSPHRSPTSPQELPGRSQLPDAPPEPGGPSPESLEAGTSLKSYSNVVALLSQWADDHLCLIRNISTGMAVAGVMLFARSIKLTSKFVSPSDIPIEFIKNCIKLRGRLHRITVKGLELEHIPISIPLISSWRRQPCGFLLIKLAGVELTEAGRLWLRKELKPFQVLWFQLLATDNSSLLCYVWMNRGTYFNVNLNEEILRRGLGKTVLIRELDHNSKVYWEVHKKLLKAELHAIRRREGVWKEEAEKSSYIEKFKGSWREIWSEGNTFKGLSFWELDLKRKSYYETLKSCCEKYKEKLSNSSFLLKVREFLSRMKLGKR
ncbi:protein C3orf33 homolog [Trichosurus vulpecula]|uniref:protein C3orf33 homolog n=1 Tax=Trichosurus vulpecula TaxID=9337 RepID=UPI00186ABE84|nr:protein C3orf33 homolog [Trichosurus vulpecula]